jgi:2-phosphosulfolactate phosphatase
MKKIEICFTPALYNLYHNTQANVVVIDIMRATTSICAAFAAGADKIIPVGTVEDAKKMKEAGYILAAERDGIVLDFADFGNSPNLFTPERVKGKTIAYSTTNGTQAINMAKDAKHVIIGAFINLSEVVKFLISDNSDVVILCSGWKKKFNIEDTLCAGAIASKLIESGEFSTICDSTYASIDLWNIAKNDVMTYIEKAAHRHRLRGIVSDEIVEYCHTIDVVKVLPICKNEVISDYLAK